MAPLWAAVTLGIELAAADSAVRRGGNEGRERAGASGRGEGRLPTPAFRTDVPRLPFDIILARPTGNAVTVSILAYDEREGYLDFGPTEGAPRRVTPRRKFPRGEPVEILLDGLAANTRYALQFHSRLPGAADFEAGPEGTFTTARPPGSAFTFTVQADPHLDFSTDPDVYRKSLANVVAAQPDFHLDLGDTFMTDKYLKFMDAAPQYLAQRYYFGLVGSRAPIFLVPGNHDGGDRARGGAGPESMAVWSTTMRKKYFPNPQPNDFYSGNAQPDPNAGLLENYYAWEWGDALFVTLDPFWNSSRSRGGSSDNWTRTLGAAQYAWLQRTLDTSLARFTFIFTHHLVGGETPEGRGGAEASAFFEWGGRDLDGRAAFAQKRPAWAAPIHDLLVRRGGGCVVFHGHDHLYARQERDGIIYQLVPQPGHSRSDNTRSAAEYGYKSGVIQGASGIMRVSVSPAESVVEYVRAYPASVESGARRTGAVTDRYVVAGTPVSVRGHPKP